MKILVITYLFPYPPDCGYKLRVFNIVRGLSIANEVDLLCFEDSEIDPRNLEQMQAFCRMVRIGKKPRLSTTIRVFRYLKDMVSGVPVALVSSWDYEKIDIIRRIAKDAAYDAIIAEHLLTGHLVHRCSSIHKGKSVSAIVNHNVEHYLYRSIHSRNSFLFRSYHYFQSWVMKRYEKRVNESFDLRVVMSEEDSYMFQKLSPRLKPIVLPNSVDSEYFSMRDELPLNHDFYFVGNLSYYPNIDAIQYFMEEIFHLVRSKVSECRFFIIGRNPPKEINRYHDGKTVMVIGYMEDIRGLARQCRVSIVPLRLGSGTRLKIVEAMSMGIPLVSTSKGAEGLNVSHGRDIALSDDRVTFANSLIRLLTDDQYASDLAANARSLVDVEYGWRNLTARFIAQLAKHPKLSS